MLTNIAIIDTETTGLDPRTDKLLEVGAVLYSLKHGAVIHSASVLVNNWARDLDPASEKIHGIPLDMLHLGHSQEFAERIIRNVVTDADAFVAHNADFDRAWLELDLTESKPWICTCNDITWPNAGDSRKLVDIALANGVGVVDAHRALTDCLTIARVLTRLHKDGVDLEALLAPGLRPKSTYVSLAGFDEKDVVKANGFRWAPEAKAWWRKMADADVASLPFRVRKTEQVFR